jgi:hypothetical protein
MQEKGCFAGNGPLTLFEWLQRSISRDLELVDVNLPYRSPLIPDDLGR